MAFWDDKVVLVSGGSAGLGHAIARQFARSGSHVVIAARSAERLETVHDEFQRDGLRVTTEVADVSSDADVARLFKTISARFGRLDGLVNCVGRSSRGLAIEITPEQFRLAFEANFLTAVRCCRAALPLLRESRGHIVNIGSLAAKVGSRFLGSYPCGKFPLAGYSQQLRLELQDDGIHVLLVCPGPIARPDAGQRYDEQVGDLPDQARKPGGGARLKGIDPDWLGRRIVAACERRERELVVPAKARILFAISQLSPAIGDWILGKMTSK